MKLNFINAITLCFVVCACSTSQDSSVSPSEQQTLSVAQSDVKENLIKKIRLSQSHLKLKSDLDKFKNSIQKRELNILIKDSKKLENWKLELQTLKTEQEVEAHYAKLFDKPQIAFALNKSLINNLSLQNIKKEIPELNNFTQSEIAELYATAMKNNASSFANAKVASCYGTCSEQLNISMDAAEGALAVAAIGCGILTPGIVPAIICGTLATAGYGFAVEAAISTFESCWNSCDRQA